MSRGGVDEDNEGHIWGELQLHRGNSNTPNGARGHNESSICLTKNYELAQDFESD